MAIDVKAEAKIAAEQFIGSGEHIYERRVRLAMWIEEFGGMIRREQMEACLACCDRFLNPQALASLPGPIVLAIKTAIRTAFAATEPQDTAAAQQQLPDKHRVMAIVLAEIKRLRDQYPTDVFGYGTAPDASPDSQSARMARLTCDNLEREIKAALRDAATEPRDIGKEK